MPSKFTLTNEDFGALLTNTSKVKVTKTIFNTPASYYAGRDEDENYLNNFKVYKNLKANKKNRKFVFEDENYFNNSKVYNNPKANKKNGNF